MTGAVDWVQPTARDGRMWKNDNPAWYEGDPLPATSYALQTATTLFRNLNCLESSDAGFQTGNLFTGPRGGP